MSELVPYRPGVLPAREEDIIAYGRECLRVGKLATEAFGRACQALFDIVGSWSRVASLMGVHPDTVREARKAAGLDFRGYQDRDIQESPEINDHRPQTEYPNPEDLPDDDPYELDDDRLFDDAPQDSIPGEVIWSDRETRLLDKLKNGETVVVNMHATGDPNLWRWAQENSLALKIDRSSAWGNPFEIPADGDRDTVIRAYAQHYLPNKPSLLNRLTDLRGRALGCWCSPDPCHGDILQALAPTDLREYL